MQLSLRFLSIVEWKLSCKVQETEYVCGLLEKETGLISRVSRRSGETTQVIFKLRMKNILKLNNVVICSNQQQSTGHESVSEVAGIIENY